MGRWQGSKVARQARGSARGGAGRRTFWIENPKLNNDNHLEPIASLSSPCSTIRLKFSVSDGKTKKIAKTSSTEPGQPPTRTPHNSCQSMLTTYEKKACTGSGSDKLKQGCSDLVFRLWIRARDPLSRSKNSNTSHGHDYPSSGSSNRQNASVSQSRLGVS